MAFGREGGSVTGSSQGTHESVTGREGRRSLERPLRAWPAFLTALGAPTSWLSLIQLLILDY